jgi:hypothetical protein
MYVCEDTYVCMYMEIDVTTSEPRCTDVGVHRISHCMCIICMYVRMHVYVCGD